MTSDYITYLIPTIKQDHFQRLLYNCFKTLENQDNSVSSQACTVVNSIFSAAFDSGGYFYGIETTYQRQKLAQLLFMRILSSELETQWSFTRPLLPLILADTEWFTAFLQHLISIQTQQPEAFEKVFAF